MVQVAMVWLGGLVAYETIRALPAPDLVPVGAGRHEVASAPQQEIVAQ